MTHPQTLQSRTHSRGFNRAGIGGLAVLCAVSGKENPVTPDPVLTLTWLSPSSGATTGTSLVTLVGSGFSSAATVSFGGVAAAASVADGTRIVVSTPPHPPGPVDVVVTNDDGKSVTPKSAYTYVLAASSPVPSITAVTPDHGSTAGGVTVEIWFIWM